MSPRNPEFEHPSPDTEPEAGKTQETPKEEPKEASVEAPAPAPDAMTAYEQEQAEYWLTQAAKEEVVRAAEKSPEQVEKERLISETEALLEKWTEQETLAQLTLIVEEKEAMESPLRKAAKEAITATTKTKKLLNPSGEWPDEFEEKRSLLGRAIGMINSGKVDHTRG